MTKVGHVLSPECGPDFRSRKFHLSVSKFIAISTNMSSNRSINHFSSPNSKINKLKVGM